MIQFKEEEVCRLIKAVQHYRDYITGSDDIWDRYNELAVKLHSYGDEVSPDLLSCEDDDIRKKTRTLPY